MCPRLILFTNEYYRVFTSAFFHANLMHIGMNMLSASAIGSALEKKVGTLALLFSIWWSVLLTSAIYVLIAYLAFAVFRYDAWMYQHAVGFSGVLFHLSVLESHLHNTNTNTNSTDTRRSVFGFFSVPPSVYPWVLLLVLQLIVPNLSFLGHLAGILTGTLEYYGFLDNVLFVNDRFLVEIESWPLVRNIASLDSFVPTTMTTMTNRQRLRAESSSSSSSSLLSSVRRVAGMIGKFVRDILETILVCVCGRNCRLGRLTNTSWCNINTTRFRERFAFPFAFRFPFATNNNEIERLFFFIAGFFGEKIQTFLILVHVPVFHILSHHAGCIKVQKNTTLMIVQV
eukprot:jgi/Psemu1/323098/estExt_fgenesh1_pg.C_570005